MMFDLANNTTLKQLTKKLPDKKYSTEIVIEWDN